MGLRLKVELEHSIRSETLKALKELSKQPRVSSNLKKILEKQQQILARLNQQQATINQIKEITMGIREDFMAFTVAVNERTNEIADALTEIQSDIERLIALSTTTPPEILAGMEEVKAKLTMLADTSKAIAALDDPVVPPPLEPPVGSEEEPL